MNDEGTWDGTIVGTSDITTPSAEGITYYELVGGGAYEGLSAVLFEAEFIDTETRQNVFPWSGVNFPGDPPPHR